MKINLFSITKIWIVIGIAFLVINFKINIIRTSWQIWIGNEICWNNIKFDLNNDFFVFPGTNTILFPISDDQPVIIGKYDSSKTAFPDDSYIIVDNVGFDVNHLSEVLSRSCKKIDCEGFEEHTSIENNVQVICIQFRGTSESLNNRQFHVFCNMKTSKILVEYHGNLNDFNMFKPIQQQILTAISATR